MTISSALLGLLIMAGPPQVTGALPAGPSRLKSCSTLAVGPPFKVHGRLYSGSHGGSTYDIWLVGTKRILSVSSSVDPPLPAHLQQAFESWDDSLYGDFTVVPLAQDRPGVRREVCVVDGDHLVVEDAETRSIRRLAHRQSQQ